MKTWLLNIYCIVCVSIYSYYISRLFDYYYFKIKTRISFANLFTTSSLQYLSDTSINQQPILHVYIFHALQCHHCFDHKITYSCNWYKYSNKETNFTVTITYLPHRHQHHLVHWWSRLCACLTGCLLGNDVWVLWGDPTLQPWSWRRPGPAWAGPLPGNLSWVAVLPCENKEIKIKNQNYESALMCLDIRVFLRNARPAILYRNVRHTTIYTRAPVILCRQHRASAAQDSRARSPRASAGSSWDTLCSVDDRPRWRHSTSISYFTERFTFVRW